MKTFAVYYEETLLYQALVKAENEDQARKLFEEGGFNEMPRCIEVVETGDITEIEEIA